jgi:hypothetical protein
MISEKYSALLRFEFDRRVVEIADRVLGLESRLFLDVWTNLM